MDATEHAEKADWIGPLEARRLLGGLNRGQFHKISARGLIGRRVLPGLRPQYSRADVERLAEASIRPATATLERAS